MTTQLPHIRFCRRVVLVAAMLVSLVAFGDPAQAQERSVPDLVEQIKPGVVFILSSVSGRKGEMIVQGSGFFISSDRVVTNWHVVEGAKSTAIKTAQGEVVGVTRVASADKVHDIAVLTLEKAVENAATLEVATSLPREGEKVVVVGNPKGLGWSVSDGLVASVRELRDTTRLIQITAPISPGSSGSPVVNMRGEVVGVAVGSKTEGQNLNFAISSEHILGLTRVDFSDVAKPARAADPTPSPDALGINERGAPTSSAAVTMAKDFYKQGVIFWDKNDYKSALTQFEKATVVNPDLAEAWYAVGLCRVRLGQKAGAIEGYKQALRVQPDMYLAHSELARLYYDLKRYKESAESYRRVAELRPDDWENRFDLGLAYLRSTQFAEAITAFKQVLRMKPDSASAYSQLGRAYYYSERYDDAAEACRRAVLFEPQNVSALYWWGLALGEQKRYGEAAEKLQEVVRLKPEYVGAYNGLGDVYYEAGKYDDAAKQYGKAIELDEGDVRPYRGLASVYAKQGRKEDGLKLLKGLVDKYPENTEALLTLGSVLSQFGNNAEARTYFSRASRLNPNDADTHLMLGHTYAQTGDYGQATVEFSEAVRLRPDESESYLIRGYNYLYLRQGGGAANDGLKFLALAGWRDEHSQYMVLVSHFGYRLTSQAEPATRILADCWLKCDTTAWPYPVVRYLRGELAEDALIGMATDNDKMTEARGYIGLNMSLLGRWQDALRHFKWVIENGNKDFTEYVMAVAESKYLEEAIKNGKGPARPVTPQPARRQGRKTH